MPDDNTPQGTVEDTVMPDDIQGVADALANILDDPEPEKVEDTEENAANAEEAEPEAEEAEVEAEAEDSESEQDEAEDGDQPRDAQGRFISPDAEVKRRDGTAVTVKELLDSEFRQSDYTRKTQDMARDRDELKSERERSNQTAQELNQQLQTLQAWVSASKPQPPSDTNPLAFIEYQRQEKAWEQGQEWLASNQKQFEEAQKAQYEEAERKYLAKEETQLVEKFPAMADPAKKETFKAEMAKFLAPYGYSAEDVKNATDHRAILIARDLMRAKRLQAKAGQTKQKVEGKPKMVTKTRRGPSAESKNKQVRAERLKERGHFDDAVAVLADMDL